MKTIALVLILAFVISACSRMSEDELFQKAQDAYEQKNFTEAIQNIQELLDRFPKGKYAEASILMLATIYNDDLQDYHNAIAAYRKFNEQFPDAEKAPMALFLVGFMYNNQLHNYDSARIAYEQFLTKYPTHEMAPSAKFELDNLGKSPDELFRTQVAEKEQPKQETGGKAKPTTRKKK